MIEIAEAHTIAHQLTETIVGRRIVRAVAGTSPHGFAFYTGDPASYGDRLSGREVTAARAWGGLVEIETDGELLVLNDGVNPRYHAPGATLPAKHQLLLDFDDGATLTCSVQMYGGMALYEPGAIDNPYYLAAREKPSPLSPEFDEAYFAALVASVKPTTSAKALLATEQRIPGLGNGSLQDILAVACVNPRTKVGVLSDADGAIARRSGNLASLFIAVRSRLEDMTYAGGRDTEKDLFGNRGGYACVRSAKTWREPCTICGGAIRREAYLGGNVYYCPSCQPFID